MKNKYIYLTLCLLGLLIPSMQSQIVSVASDYGFNIKAGTVIGAEGLDLTPSADFSLDTSLVLSSVLNNGASINHINRNYIFEATTAPFSGNLQFNYDESELNSLDETNLKLLYNNGSIWNIDNSSTNNATANYETTTLTAKPLKELSLGINNSTPTIQTETACGSYTWSVNGQTYTTSGTYTETSTNASGFKVINKLVLTIKGITTQPEAPQLCSAGGSLASVSVTTNVTSPVYSWQYRVVSATDPNPTWRTITSANFHVYKNYTTATLGIIRTSTPLPAEGTQYRVLISSSGCAQLISNMVPLTINPTTIAKTITGNTPNVCYGGNKTLTLASGSVGTIQWQRNVNNSTTAPLATDANWSDVGDVITPTAATNVANSLVLTNVTNTTWYRVKFTSGACSLLYATAVRVVVDPTAVVGTVSVSTSQVCTGSSATLTLSNNTGVIKWVKSTNYDLNDPTAATWTAISGTTASVSTGTLTARTWFRAEVTSGTCGTLISNSVDVDVSPKVVVKTITGNTPNVCYGGNRTLTLASGSVGTIQWQRNVTASTTTPLSTDTNWSDVGDVTTPTAATNAANSLDLTNVTNTCWYRVKFTSGACSVGYSVAVRVVVDPTAVVGAANVSTSQVCTGSSATLTLSNNTGVIKWVKSINYDLNNPTAATWAIVSGTTASVSTGALTAKTWFRAEVTSGVCSTVGISNVVDVNVSPKPVAKNFLANTTVPSGATSLLGLCRDLSTPKTFTLATDYRGIIQWQTVASNTTPTSTTVWTDIVGATDPTYTVGQNEFIPAIGRNYFRVKFSSSPCSTDVFSTSLAVWYKDCNVVKLMAPNEVVVTPTQVPFEVKAYPNPYTESFNLSLTTSSEDKVSILVYDMTGRLIERSEVKPSEMAEQEIGTRYPNGIYNIVVTQGDALKTVRVVKR